MSLFDDGPAEARGSIYEILWYSSREPSAWLRSLVSFSETAWVQSRLVKNETLGG